MVRWLCVLLFEFDFNFKIRLIKAFMKNCRLSIKAAGTSTTNDEQCNVAGEIGDVDAQIGSKRV